MGQHQYPVITARAGTISLRPIADDDREFLLAVYSSARREELDQVAWEEDQRAAFLKMQFDAQHLYYQEHYAGADFMVIMLGDLRVGRLYLTRLPDEIRLIDIAILPEWRNAGLGTALLELLMSEARGINKVLRIHVEKFNPALRLYERLGFRMIADRGVYWFMEWKPE
jgi:ribosomal protein S18 acetylase RimI-like enzyme